MKPPRTPCTISLDCLDLKLFASRFSCWFDFPRDRLFFNILGECAVNNDSLESHCNLNGQSPDQFQRYMARVPLEKMVLFSAELLKLSLNQLRKNGWRCPRKGVLLAIDYHDEEYYGDTDEYVHNTIRRHEERHRSVTVHRYISASIVNKRFKFSLCILPVKPGDSAAKLVELLLQIIKKQVKVEAVLLDRGFFVVDVLDVIGKQNTHYIIPIKKGNRDIEISYWLSVETDKWTWKHVVYKNRKEGIETTLFLKETKFSECIGFLTNRKIGYDTYRKLQYRYDKRWNVENTYKEAEHYRIRTSSVNLTYRFLLMTIAHLLVNLQELVRYARIRIRVYEMKIILLLLLNNEIRETPVRVTKRLYVQL